MAGWGARGRPAGIPHALASQTRINVVGGAVRPCAAEPVQCRRALIEPSALPRTAIIDRAGTLIAREARATVQVQASLSVWIGDEESVDIYSAPRAMEGSSAI